MTARRLKRRNVLAVLRTPGWARIVLLRRFAAAILVLCAALALFQPAVTSETADVYVARSDLESGEPIAAENIELVAVPKGLIPATASTEIVGSIPIGPIGRGEIITDLRLVSENLLSKLDPGDEEHNETHIVSIRPNDPILIAHLNTGDAVDIVSTDRNSGQAKVIAAGGRVVTALNVESERDAAVLVALSRDNAAEVAAAGLSGQLTLLLTSPH